MKLFSYFTSEHMNNGIPSQPIENND